MRTEVRDVIIEAGKKIKIGSVTITVITNATIKGIIYRTTIRALTTMHKIIYVLEDTTDERNKRIFATGQTRVQWHIVYNLNQKRLPAFRIIWGN